MSLISCMEQSSSWEDNSHSSDQEIPSCLYNWYIHYRVYNSPSLVRILSQPNPLNTLVPFRLIFLNSTLLSADLSLLSGS